MNWLWLQPRRRREREFQQLFPDGLDRHAHILWGVDDGARSREEAQGIVDSLKAMGLKGAWCTPHVMASLPDNTPERLKARFREALEELNLGGFLLSLAAEYMLDESFPDHVRRGELLSWDGKRVLVELSRLQLPADWEEMLFRLRVDGWIPVLAHPERYGSLLSFDELWELHERDGVEFQVTWAALRGKRSRSEYALARKLWKAGLCDWCGTDSHRSC